MRSLEQHEVQQVAGGNAAADCLGFAASVASVGLAAPGTPANTVAAVAAVAAGIGCASNVSVGPASASVDSCAVSVSPEGGSVCTTASDGDSASAASASCAADASACGPGGDGGGGGGGKVICTELCRMGAIDHALWMADIRYSQGHFSARTLRGYHLWGIPFVRLMRRHPVLTRLALPPVRWFAEDIGYRMGIRAVPNRKGWVLREVLFRPLCTGLGLFARSRDWRALWPDDEQLARRA